MKSKNSVLTNDLKGRIDDYFYEYNETCSEAARLFKNDEIDKKSMNKMKLEASKKYNDELFKISDEHGIDIEVIMQYSGLV